MSLFIITYEDVTPLLPLLFVVDWSEGATMPDRFTEIKSSINIKPHQHRHAGGFFLVK